MSLVLEALRRVEKPGERTGRIGAAVASYTRAPTRRGPAIPLLLGLASGGAMVLFLESPSGSALNANHSNAEEAAAPQTRPLKGRAGLPPPLILETLDRPEGDSRSAGGRTASAATIGTAAPAKDPSRAVESSAREQKPVPLTLQAISERDSQPIAVINDQLVKEGDKLGAVRVFRIGPDFVEVRHDDGKTETVRFSPPPPQDSPTPDPR